MKKESWISIPLKRLMDETSKIFRKYIGRTRGSRREYYNDIDLHYFKGYSEDYVKLIYEITRFEISCCDLSYLAHHNWYYAYSYGVLPWRMNNHFMPQHHVRGLFLLYGNDPPRMRNRQ
ncbi:MAG: hypothetical protein ACFE9L_04055 [Candidatus Hodarchaeota archaeon]